MAKKKKTEQIKKKPMPIPELHRREFHDGDMWGEVVYNCNSGLPVHDRKGDVIGEMQIVVFAYPLEAGWKLRGGIYGPEIKIAGEYDWLPNFALISLYKEMEDMPHIPNEKLDMTAAYLMAYLRQYAHFTNAALYDQWSIFLVYPNKARIDKPELFYAETLADVPAVLHKHPYFINKE